jgi:hypothetical protein
VRLERAFSAIPDDSEAVHTFEFVRIRGDERKVVANTRCGNPQVVCSDQPARRT